MNNMAKMMPKRRATGSRETPYDCYATESKYRYKPKETLIAEWTDEDGRLHKEYVVTER